ncbi:peptidoglycan-binding protein [Streptomyces sp. NPDC048650]|uniref:peptidoglycan-binding protein n=1 Tax=unclassified Streptomyces TaxID=2593676 RepID=UPI0037142EE0
MSTPLTPDRFLAALRAEGVHVVEHDGWRGHNRNHQGPWGPVNGVMLHHTAGTDSVALCEAGLDDLPGPLCVGVLTKSGALHLVGFGRTNHAGRGARATYDAVCAESATPARPGRDAIDGNVHFYGFEIENLGNGRDPYPEGQLAAVERVSAAVCRAHGWTAASVIGHKEWTTRKIDPSFSMAAMRARIARRLGSAPTQPPRDAVPFPGAPFFTTGRRSPVVTAMGRRLVAEGCGRYTQGPGPAWSPADRSSYAAWQRKLGYTGADADGIPGRVSWDRLRVPAGG